MEGPPARRPPGGLDGPLPLRLQGPEGPRQGRLLRHPERPARRRGPLHAAVGRRRRDWADHPDALRRAHRDRAREDVRPAPDERDDRRGQSTPTSWCSTRNKVRTISASTHHMRVDYSCYEGREVVGSPEVVLQRGNVLVERGEFFGEARRRAVPRAAALLHAHPDATPRAGMTSTSETTVRQLIDGEFTAGHGHAEEVLDPASGRVLAVVRHSTTADVDAAVRAAAAAFPSWADTAGPGPRRGHVPLQGGARGPRRRAHRARHGRERQDARRGPRRGAPCDRGRRALVRWADPPARHGARPDRERDRRGARAIPRRRRRGHLPVQLPDDGAAVDAAARARRREHLRAEAVPAHPAVGGARARAAGRGRPAARRREPRPRRPRARRGAAGPPARRRRELRRLCGRRAPRLWDRRGLRQARPGAGRGEEPPARDGRRRPRPDRARRARLRLRQRGPAVPRGQRRGRRRDRRRPARGPARRGRGVAPPRPGDRPRRTSSARSSPRRG